MVESLGPELRATRLAMVLGALSESELDGFCRCLGRMQNDLDTVDHHAHAQDAFESRRQETARPWTCPDSPCKANLGDLQMTVVAHGRDAWQAVVAAPALMSGGWPTGLGRQFLRTITDACRVRPRGLRLA